MQHTKRPWRACWCHTFSLTQPMQRTFKTFWMPRKLQRTTSSSRLMNINAYLEGDAGTEGSGQIGETLVGVNSQQLSVWQMEGGTEGGRKGGRERLRHWTTGGDKVDKKRRRYPKSSQTSLILPVSFFINYPLFPPFLPLPFVLFLISHQALSLSLSSYKSHLLLSLYIQKK